MYAARRQVQRHAGTIAEQLVRLEDSQTALIQSEKLAAVGRMVAGVAHEVRNPLAVIRSSASLVLEAPDLDASTRRPARFIVEEADRLDGFVRKLLDFSRPTPPTWADADLSQVVADAIVLASPHLATHTVDTDEVPAIRSLVDPSLLTRALATLLTNAAEASDTPRHIHCRAGRSADGLWIEVEDDGPGIDHSIANTLFDPFVTTKARGTGLGLAMARRLVEVQGGTLVLAPQTAPGARFRITLPQRAEAA